MAGDQGPIEDFCTRIYKSFETYQLETINSAVCIHAQNNDNTKMMK